MIVVMRSLPNDICHPGFITAGSVMEYGICDGDTIWREPQHRCKDTYSAGANNYSQNGTG